MVRQALAGHAVDQAVLLLRRGARGWSSTAATRWTRTRASATRDWFHLVADDVLSMPDKWEYPWFAAWDLAFHAIPLAMVDIGFAKQQLDVLLRRLYLHPNGQMPAYEWNFTDVNPPVHAWATYFVYQLEKGRTGAGDLSWLEAAFQKLVKNFTWWVNRKDPEGRNVFQGGFLGLDNIGVFDRSAPLPTGGHLDQADGTAWMALYAQVMLAIALELSTRDPLYLEQAETFFEHFAWIAVAMNRVGPGRTSMWDEEDGFFYDVLRLPDGKGVPLKVRSMVGLLPLAAATVIPSDVDARFPEPGGRRAGVHRPASRRVRRRVRRPPGRRPAGPPAVRAVRRGPAAAGSGPDARRGRVPQPATGSGRCPATTPTTRTRSAWTATTTGCPTCRRSPTPACSAATRTGAARSGSRSTPC